MKKLTSLKDMMSKLVAEATINYPSDEAVPIIDFTHNILFNGQEILFPQQRTVLKTFYGEELLPIEEDILNTWKEEDKTNWVKDRKYKDLILEVGRGGCPCGNELIYTTKGIMTYEQALLLYEQEDNFGICTYDEQTSTSHITTNFKLWDKGILSACTVYTESGRKESNTTNHQYQTLRDGQVSWVEVKDIKIGDYIKVPIFLPLYGTNDMLSVSTAIDIGKTLSELPNNLAFLRGSLMYVLKAFIASVVITYGSSRLLSTNKDVIEIKYPDQYLLSELQIFLTLFGIDSFLKGSKLSITDKISLRRTINTLHETSDDYIQSNLYKFYIPNLPVINFTDIEYKWEQIAYISPVFKSSIIGIEVPNTHTVVGTFLSHNSKSLIATIISAYEFYNLMSLPDPAARYGLISSDPIGIFLIATTETQVKETLFGKLKGYMLNSHYFRTALEQKKIQILEKAIKCSSKNIAIYAKHTNSEALVGYNLKCLILDEVARFSNKINPDGTITSLADELWGNVGRATQRFGEYGKKVAISSAWEWEDPIDRFRKGSFKNPNQISFSLCTWDLNKRLEASRDACNSDYIDNREKAELEYENIRRTSNSAVFPQKLLEDSSIGFSVIDCVKTELDVETEAGLREYVGLDITRIEKESKYPTFLHIDFATSKDSAGLAFSHPVIDGSTFKIHVDGLLKWTPYLTPKGTKRLVYYDSIETAILTICQSRNVVAVTFDQWNSQSTIQRLHSLGIRAFQVSCSRSNQLEYFTLTSTLLQQGVLTLPKDNIFLPSLHSEFGNISIQQSGSITHGIHGKDLADAVVNSVFQCYKYLSNMGFNARNFEQSDIKIIPSNCLISIDHNQYNKAREHIKIGRDLFHKMKTNKII